MSDDVIQILVTVGILLLGILQPLISKLRKKGGVNVPEIVPDIPEEEFVSEEGNEEDSALVINVSRPATDAQVAPEQAKMEFRARQVAREFSPNETRKKREPLDKRKMIIYSEIMKPKFDDF